MHAKTRVAVSFFVTVCLLIAAAPISNMTGSWHLDVDKSKWGKKKKPQSVDVNIEHNEPALKYSGNVVDTDEASHRFEYVGAVDDRRVDADRLP